MYMYTLLSVTRYHSKIDVLYKETEILFFVTSVSVSCCFLEQRFDMKCIVKILRCFTASPFSFGTAAIVVSVNRK